MVAQLLVGLICGHESGSVVVLWYWKVGRGEYEFGDVGFPPIFFKKLEISITEFILFHHRTCKKSGTAPPKKEKRKKSHNINPLIGGNLAS